MFQRSKVDERDLTALSGQFNPLCREYRNFKSPQQGELGISNIFSRKSVLYSTCLEQATVRR
jgi:hypothetical protein